MKTIAYYSDTAKLGGSEVYLRTILQNIDRNRYKIIVFCPDNHPLLKFFEERGFKVIFIRKSKFYEQGQSSGRNRNFLVKQGWKNLAPKWLALAVGTLKEIKRLKREFQAYPVDLMHFNDTGCEPPVIAARLARVPIILGTFHVLPSYDRKKMDWVRRLIEFVSLRSPDAGIAVSHAVKNAWMIRTFLNGRNIKVIYNGIELNTFDQLMENNGREFFKDLNLPDNAYLICVPARLHPMKGHEYLLGAIPGIMERYPYVHFLCVGEGELKDKLKQLCRTLNISNNVHFLGFRSDIHQIMALSDLIVLPSEWEALGYVLIEGMACSKPAVATNFSGIPEVVDHQITGLLVERRNSDELAKAILYLMDNRNIAKEMGRKGREKVESLFTQDKMLYQTFELYENLLKSRKSMEESGILKNV